MTNRFSKIDAQGRALPHDAADWAAVYDATTGLMWTANDVGGGEVTHADAEQACSALTLLGHTDWRLPTVEELFALADRSRTSPAIDTDFFPNCPSDWFWTSTPAAWSPSSFAWFVYFNLGLASPNSRSYDAFVRAVRSVPVAPVPGQ